MSIYKEVCGKGEEIVILHGSGFNHEYMKPIVDDLSSIFKVTNFDLPGRGKSDWHTDIKNIHDVADQLIEYLPSYATYIGWSFGGLVSQSIATRYPERVKQFIGITTTPKFIASHDWVGVPPPGFSAFIPIIKKQGFNGFIKDFVDIEFADQNPKPKNYHEVIKILNNHLENEDLEVFSKIVNICDEADLRRAFSSLKCPINLIMGENDAAIPNQVHDKILQLNKFTRIHTIAGAGHMPFWTHPQEFNSLVNEILREN